MNALVCQRNVQRVSVYQHQGLCVRKFGYKVDLFHNRLGAYSTNLTRIVIISAIHKNTATMSQKSSIFLPPELLPDCDVFTPRETATVGHFAHIVKTQLCLSKTCWFDQRAEHEALPRNLNLVSSRICTSRTRLSQSSYIRDQVLQFP